MLLKFIWNQKRPSKFKAISRKIKLEGSHFLTSGYTTKPNNQNSMVQAQTPTHRSMEQNKEPRNKPMHLWLINLQQRMQEYTMEKI